MCLYFICFGKFSFHIANFKTFRMHTVFLRILCFFEFVKSWKFHIVSALIFLLCTENLNSFLTRVQKLFKVENYLRKYSIPLIKAFVETLEFFSIFSTLYCFQFSLSFYQFSNTWLIKLGKIELFWFKIIRPFVATTKTLVHT